jgi:hypothetical protein
MRYSPSKLGDWELCPRFEYQVTEKKNEAAEEGDLCHRAYETGDRSQLTPEQVTWVDDVDIYTRILSEGSVCTWSEYPVELDNIRPGDSIRGRADKVIFFPDLAHVIDAKFGRKEVAEAEVNLQGIAYAVCLFEMHPNLNQVTTHFVSPRIHAQSNHTFQREECERLQGIVRAVLEARSNPFIPARAHTQLCGICQFRGRGCPAAQTAMTPVLVELMPPTRFDLTHLLRTPVSELTATEKSKLKALCQLITSILEQKEADLTTEARNGAPVTGYKLVSKRGNPTIVDPLTAELTMKAAGLVTEEDLQRIRKLSFSDVRTLLKGKLDEYAVEELLGPCVVRGMPVQYLQKERGMDLIKLLAE